MNNRNLKEDFMSIKYALFYAFLSLFFANSVLAQMEEMPVPRYASLRSGVVNSRFGPGKRYPIEWVYKQKGAPVEIIQAFEYRQELWYKIRDWEDSESWVHHSMISKNRMAKVINDGLNNVYAKDDYESKIVAKAEAGAIGKIEKCPRGSEFCLIKFKTEEGWVPKKFLFGMYENEVVR